MEQHSTTAATVPPEEKPLAAELIEQVERAAASAGSSPRRVFEEVCQCCSGTGWELIEGKGARPCRCRAQKRSWTDCPGAMAINDVPSEFRHLRLATIQAIRRVGDRHHKQGLFIAKMREYASCTPPKSWLIYGECGAGKTALAYTIAIDAIERGRPVYCGLLSDVLDSHQRSQRPVEAGGVHEDEVLIPLRVLQRAEPQVTVYLDDVDKLRDADTPFRIERTFQIFDAIYRHNHQLIITAQVPPAQLVSTWRKIRSEHAEGIVRRMQEIKAAVELDFFKPPRQKGSTR